MKKIFLFIFIFIILFLNGCYLQKIEIDSIKSWEGHYMNEEDFYNKTKNIKLENDESIWVLSNKSLSHILKEQGKK